MLELKNIKKTYVVGDIETKALDGISVSFREKEFVAILGESGSGKTTCLNIVGGLDRYDSGSLVIKGRDTRNFRERDWDAYRNNSIGFVFQSYNLITHLSIVANVELSMTLSGVSMAEKHKRALEVLHQVGLKEHLHKKPNQLSGGQMQRVAIARALVNNPEILLCDEPTGALDSATSIQIMDLIKEIAKDRLVIVVTHNPKVAEKYADRTIEFSDGKIISDTNPYFETQTKERFSLTKTAMSFATALKISFNNIRTKKGRTFLTSLGSSIGIIGIAVILSLSTGLKIEIENFQKTSMAEFPIIVAPQGMDMSEERMAEIKENKKEEKRYPKTDHVKLYDPKANMMQHLNIITQDYVDYIEKIDPRICTSIGYIRYVPMNMIRKDGDEYKQVKTNNSLDQSIRNAAAGPAGGGAGADSGNSGGMNMGNGMSNMGLSSYPQPISDGDAKYLNKYFDLLDGAYPSEKTDLVLVVDRRNRMSFETAEYLGIDTSEETLKEIKFKDILNTEIKLILNNDYFEKNAYNLYRAKTDLSAMYNSEGAVTLKITGIVRAKESAPLGFLSPGLAYSQDLVDFIIDDSKKSDIYKAQTEQNENGMFNIMNANPIENKKDLNSIITSISANSIPLGIMIYPTGFDEKAAVCDYLDKYNVGKEKEAVIIYTDLMELFADLVSGVIDGVLWVLIAFAAISLVVSLIMICIITYTSVIERTKEIGILKALGARKKDITRVFDAETCILGVFSGLLGVGIAYLLTIPINIIVNKVAGLESVSQLRIDHALLLIIISTLLTMLGGHLPARMASRKDAVEALRTE